MIDEEKLAQIERCIHVVACAEEFCEYYEDCKGVPGLLHACFDEIVQLRDKNQWAENRATNYQLELQRLRAYRKR